MLKVKVVRHGQGSRGRGAGLRPTQYQANRHHQEPCDCEWRPEGNYFLIVPTVRSLFFLSCKMPIKICMESYVSAKLVFPYFKLYILEIYSVNMQDSLAVLLKTSMLLPFLPATSLLRRRGRISYRVNLTLAIDGRVVELTKLKSTLFANPSSPLFFFSHL